MCCCCYCRIPHHHRQQAAGHCCLQGSALLLSAPLLLPLLLLLLTLCRLQVSQYCLDWAAPARALHMVTRTEARCRNCKSKMRVHMQQLVESVTMH